jgi:hypothetical protein
MPIHALLHLIQQHDLPLQLISNLHTQLPLAPNTQSQLIQLVILVAQHLAVIFVDLLIVEAGVVGCGFGVGLVAVREKLCAIGIFRNVVVAEADGFVGGAGLLLGGGEVGFEGGVVGFGGC